MKAKSFYGFLAVSGVLALFAVNPAAASLVLLEAPVETKTLPVNQTLDFSYLPHDIVKSDIFGQLPLSDLITCARVCKSWKHLVELSDRGYHLRGYQNMMTSTIQELQLFNNSKEDLLKYKCLVSELVKMIDDESTFGMSIIPKKHFENLYNAGTYSLHTWGNSETGSNSSEDVALSSFGIILGQEGAQKMHVIDWPFSVITPNLILQWNSDNLTKPQNLSVGGSGALWGLSTFTGLKKLDLQGIVLTNFAFIKIIKNLQKLKLDAVTIDALPQELAGLPDLKSLKILNCKNLKNFEVLSQLSQLKTFSSQDNTAIIQLPVLPGNLEKIFFAQQPAITNWDAALKQTTQLKTIKFWNHQLKTLPQAICGQSNLETLDIKELQLPQSEIDKLRVLKKQKPGIKITLNNSESL
jgi:hypothetical protein